MNLETFELAKRAVACKNWKWMPGMRLISGMDIPPGRVQDDGSVAHGTKGGLVVCFDDIPDMTDPATIGCLLDLVRKAWHTAPANVNSHTSYSPEKGHYRYWTCSYCTGEKWEQTQGKTEAEALVSALEASNV